VESYCGAKGWEIPARYSSESARAPLREAAVEVVVEVVAAETAR
jgi:hypothetical protein